MRTVLCVPAMSCRHGVRDVSHILRDVPGVTTVTADATTRLVTVTGSARREALRRALAAGGYDTDDRRPGSQERDMIIELSHRIEPGMPSYPGLPGLALEEHLSHVDSREHYQGQAEFSITRLAMVGNTGTYLDSPFHRFPDREDVAGIALERLVDLDTLVVDVHEGEREIRVRPQQMEGRAVLFRSGWSRRWGSAAYWDPGPFLGRVTVDALVEAGAALVGVDFWNVDDTDDPARPAHTGLLGAGVVIVEHLRDLDRLPTSGARFSAVPLAIAGAASLPVRAWARVDD